uniref:Zgc:77151 n=1 Tax=Myripristis murdjan TaxID=586833 RepID=A0A667Z5M1_9TELE
TQHITKPRSCILSVLLSCQWLGAPSCLRGGYAFYKSVSSTAQPGGPVQVWKLGEFYYIRCGPQEPACIAEVTLLWEDQTQRHLLASARLYFLPEDTPKGRTREHGEDEVLAVSRKMVVRVEDLVRWSCPEPASWRNTRTNDFIFKTSVIYLSSALCLSDGPVQQQQQQQQGVKVLSYPQYCRFRSLQRRIQDRAGGPGLQDPHLLALGGIRLALPNMRVMYCRDTFSHPTLESNSNFWWQFRCPSLSLRGRPRKRRGRDSKDSPTSSQSDSWIERMKENVMGSVEMGCEGGWLPHPEEQLFLDQLYTFMERHGSPIHKVPNLGFKKIDLFLMYSVVKRLGGYEKVTSERLWKVVYNELGGCPGSTSAATCTRRHYERSDRNLTKIHPVTIPYSYKTSFLSQLKQSFSNVLLPPSQQVVNPDGTVVVKRGRGRPPGKRNKPPVLVLCSQVQQPLQKAPAQAVHPALHPANLPLTPDLSPMSSPFLPFQPKPGKEQERGSSLTQPSSPGVLLSVPPRPFVGGSLGGFSPTKGMCPLDVFRSRLGLQRGLESPALTPQDPAHDQPQPQCTGCNLDDGAQRGGSRDGKNRPPLPPLRVLPLDLDCSVQVRQLMRTRLGSAQFQSFTRRLSEVLSQDLSAKPPCSPITPPPEQALPLNLSKRFLAKRPPSDDPEPRETAMNGGSGPQPSSKRPRDSCGDQVKAEDFSLGGRSGGSGGGRALEMKIQEEPADLSSPSRIRAFLLGLQPFHVKLEEDLNGASLVKPLPPPSEATSQRTEAEHGERGGNVTIEVKKEEETIKTEHDESERSEKESSQEDKPPNEEPAAVKAEFVKAEDVKMERQDVKEEAEASVASSMDQIGDLGGQQMPREEKMECDVEASAKGLPSPVLPQPTALALAQQS